MSPPRVAGPGSDRREPTIWEEVCAQHERLLREYHEAWREALQVRSREVVRGRPRDTYLGWVPRAVGCWISLSLGLRWVWSVPSDPVARKDRDFRVHSGRHAGHAASFVRRFTGGHLSKQLRSLSKAYLQLAHAPYVPAEDRSRFAEMAVQCDELAGTFPAWRDSVRSALPLLGLALGPILAALAIDGAWKVLLAAVVVSYTFLFAVAMTAFESFRLKRELLFPGARERELRGDAAPPTSDERNAYWGETLLHYALGRPQQRELPIDYLIAFLVCASLAVFAIAPVLRMLPNDSASLAAQFLLVAVLPLGWFSVNWLARKRFWR